MPNILIVEDNEENIQDAVDAIAEAKIRCNEAGVARNLIEARNEMNRISKHGSAVFSHVLLDFHFPLTDKRNLINEDQLPSALLFIPEFIGRAKIVVVTDIYHHAEKFHVYNHIMRFQYPNIPIIDLYKGQEGTKKDWKNALRKLLA